MMTWSLILAFLISAFSGLKTDDSITKWEKSIVALEKRQAIEKTKGGIVFYGSSSIRLWDSVDQDMLPWKAIQRGYGGAKLKDINHFAPRILGPHLGKDNSNRCRAIVIFVANDITGNTKTDLSPEQVGESFEKLLKWIRSKDETIPVFWIEVTPTGSRWNAWDAISQATNRIRKTTDRDSNAYLIPTAGAFFDKEGKPDSKFFVADRLHLNAKGYSVWSALIKTQLHLRLGPASKPLEKLPEVTLNQKADGYRGIWYMNQPSGDEYVYKYSGGLGTYCAKHRPFAIYCKEVDKTFFCYGGAKADNDRALLHMVSCFDHQTGTVARPTILLDKNTSDAHDNPVISIDRKGHVWIFSTSHGRARPSYIHKSKRPYDIGEFKQVHATRFDAEKSKPVAMTNFSYMQVWNHRQAGFAAFFTRYGFPAKRTICFMTSKDGESWSEWQRIAAIADGHYQISGMGKSKFAAMFNYHPEGKGLNWRTNLYYVETLDNGKTWRTVDGTKLELPLTEVNNRALIRNYESEGLNVYLKDVQFDQHDHPVLLYITSKGYQSGPKNSPRTWTIAKWTGDDWRYSEVATSDNNYDFGELIIRSQREWLVIGPTETGPQPFNPGGEVALWRSVDQGKTWTRQKQLTANSKKNHTYMRQVLNADPDFVAIWADGHGRQPSASSLYIADADGNVYRLPRNMGSANSAKLEKVIR